MCNATPSPREADEKKFDEVSGKISKCGKRRTRSAFQTSGLAADSSLLRQDAAYLLCCRKNYARHAARKASHAPACLLHIRPTAADTHRPKPRHSTARSLRAWRYSPCRHMRRQQAAVRQASQPCKRIFCKVDRLSSLCQFREGCHSVPSLLLPGSIYFTSTLSIRAPSISTTSKVNPFHSTVSPLAGMCCSCCNISPLTVW